MTPDPTTHAGVVVEHRGLPRGDPVDGLLEQQAQRLRATVSTRAATVGERARSFACTRVAPSSTRASRSSTSLQREAAPRAHHELVARGVGAQHVERRGRREPEPAALPGRVGDGARVAPELVPGLVADAARGERTPSRARKSSSAPPPRKQTSWLSRAVAAAMPAAAASARTAALVASPSGSRRRASTSGGTRASMYD